MQRMSMSASAIRNRERRRVLKEAGLCVLCGREKSYGKSICGTCQQKRCTPEGKQRKAELNREYRIRRAERGVCRHCGREAVSGLNLCSHHRQKKAEWNERYYNRLRIEVLSSSQNPPWFLSFDCETTPTVFEMGVGQ